MSEIRNLVNRTPETRERYRKERDGTDTLPHEREKTIAEYTHWKVMENRFPYDAVFSTHHMLVSKRIFPMNENPNPEEQAELDSILRDMAREDRYDGYLENFPTGQSKPGHKHIHLFVWKYENETIEAT